MNDQVALIERFLLEKKLKNIVLIGHSYGGGVALITQLGLQQKRKKGVVQRLILLDCAAYKDKLPFFIKQLAQPVFNHLMLNITNEGWFGPAALYQKVAASVFRAVENRRSLARATNTGISCFIDPYGRILGRVNQNGQEVSVAGSLTRDVPVTSEQTIYTRYGNGFALINVFVLICMLAVAIKKGRPTL